MHLRSDVGSSNAAGKADAHCLTRPLGGPSDGGGVPRADGMGLVDRPPALAFNAFGWPPSFTCATSGVRRSG